MNQYKQKLGELEERIGHHFQNSELLFLAMSHSSFTNEQKRDRLYSNERLEFLGDAVLEMVTSDYLYHAFPRMPEGDMTKLRASLVCEPTLDYSARELCLEEFVLLGRGEEQTGGRGRSSIISDATEALIGALYLDGGLEAARAFILRFLLNDIEHKKLFYDSKTSLQELSVKLFPDRNVEYVLVREEGPDHAKVFVSEVRIGDGLCFQGKGSSKKGAEQDAARKAILSLHNKL